MIEDIQNKEINYRLDRIIIEITLKALRYRMNNSLCLLSMIDRKPFIDDSCSVIM